MKIRLLTLLVVTFAVAGCEPDESITQNSQEQTKLDYYIDSYNLDDMGFEANYKVVYEYASDGKLEKYTFFTYDQETQVYDKQRHFEFQYSNERVLSIKGYHVGDVEPYLEHSYEYQGEAVSKITELNHDSGINSVANFAYINSDSIRVSYSFSNGGSYQYAFMYGDKNITLTKTTRGAQLCSKGVYAYDSKINPLSTLGYVDYFLYNLSHNNKLAENVDYVGCSFPSFIPESYSYQYNEEGFPTEVITHYKSETGAKSKRQFFYKKM